MSEKIFIDGIHIKEIETQYGIIYKLSVDIQKFNEFARNHASTSESNGKKYLNMSMLSKRDGGKYLCLDQWKKEVVSEDFKKESDNLEINKFENDDIPF